MSVLKFKDGYDRISIYTQEEYNYIIGFKNLLEEESSYSLSDIYMRKKIYNTLHEEHLHNVKLIKFQIAHIEYDTDLIFEYEIHIDEDDRHYEYEIHIVSYKKKRNNCLVDYLENILLDINNEEEKDILKYIIRELSNKGYIDINLSQTCISNYIKQKIKEYSIQPSETYVRDLILYDYYQTLSDIKISIKALKLLERIFPTDIANIILEYCL